MKSSHSLLSRALCALIAVFHIAVMSSAHAQNVVQAGSGLSADYVKDFLHMNANVLRNNSGAIILNLPADEASEAIFSLIGAKPMVWGRYSPDTGTGTIQVVRVERVLLPDKDGSRHSLKFDHIDPETLGAGYNGAGNGIVQRYNGVDPFSPFARGNGLWNGITQHEFLTAVGHTAMKYSTTNGYVAVGNISQEFHQWTRCKVKVLGGCIRKEYNQQLKTSVTPKWFTLATPSQAPGRTFVTGFHARGCGDDVAACTVSSGLAFLENASGSDFPVETHKFSTLDHKFSAWTGLAMAFAFAALAIVAAPYAFSQLGVFTGLLNTAAANTVVTAYGAFMVELGGYALTSQVFNGDRLTDAHDGLFQTKKPDAGIYQQSDIAPQWNYRPRLIQTWNNTPLAHTPGGVGEQYTQKMQTEEDAIPYNPLKAMKENPHMRFWEVPRH